MTKEELEEYMEKTQKEIDFLVEKSFRDDLSEEDISNLSKEIYTKSNLIRSRMNLILAQVELENQREVLDSLPKKRKE